MNINLYLSVLLSAFLGVSATLNNNSPYIKLPLGGIKGYYKKSAEGRLFAAFESVPYAQPPIGKLRFEPPVPVEPWSEVLQAVSLPTACSQFNSMTFEVFGKEDCLFLNIYTPVRNRTNLLPVIIFIHGGGFQFGLSAEYGPKYLMDKDLVFVSLNYRIGPFGFLSTGDGIVPGNMGLKDQSLALRWVSRYARFFGGDPKRVTLTGVSAGAASVHYHYMSPMSAGLFRNGISFSGTALCSWAYADDMWETSRVLAQILRCPTLNKLATIECLKKMSSADILQAARAMTPADLYFSYATFAPVAEKVNENYFINDSPTNILEKGKMFDVPWITGVVSEEGLFKVAGFVLNETLMEYTDVNWDNVAPYLLQLRYSIPADKLSAFVNKAKYNYFRGIPINSEKVSIRNLTHLVGDELIVAGAIKAAKMQSKINTSGVRFYYYSYRAAQSFSSELTNSNVDIGVSHEDDTGMVLENFFLDPTTTECDRDMSKKLVQFWYSVAAKGEPDFGVKWPKLYEVSDELHYMHIAGPNNITMEINNNLGENFFWSKLDF